MPGMKRDCGGAAAVLGAFYVAVKQVWDIQNCNNLIVNSDIYILIAETNFRLAEQANYVSTWKSKPLFTLYDHFQHGEWLISIYIDMWCWAMVLCLLEYKLHAGISYRRWDYNGQTAV